MLGGVVAVAPPDGDPLRLCVDQVFVHHLGRLSLGLQQVNLIKTGEVTMESEHVLLPPVDMAHPHLVPIKRDELAGLGHRRVGSVVRDLI
eukprot:3060376-Prymnesium_polylepis.3